MDRLMAFFGMRGEPRAVVGGQVVSCPRRFSGRVSADECLLCPWAAVEREPRSDRFRRVRCGSSRWG